MILVMDARAGHAYTNVREALAESPARPRAYASQVILTHSPAASAGAEPSPLYVTSSSVSVVLVQSLTAFAFLYASPMPDESWRTMRYTVSYRSLASAPSSVATVNVTAWVDSSYSGTEIDGLRGFLNV